LFVEEDRAVRHAVFVVDLVSHCGAVGGGIRPGARAGRSGLQRTQIAAEAATGVELQQHQTPDLPSPDGVLRALVFPVDVSLYATPDMESRVVIRTSNGDTVTSKDYSSPRGTNGHYVVNAKWSPDSQFFVYSMSSSGGHSPWSFPMMVYSHQKKHIAGLSDMIDGGRPFRRISTLPDRTRWSSTRGNKLARWTIRSR
jgi:hypothetical protein